MLIKIWKKLEKSIRLLYKVVYLLRKLQLYDFYNDTKI